MIRKSAFLILCALLMTGCGLLRSDANAPAPTTPGSWHSGDPLTASFKPVTSLATPCPAPAGWVAFQVPVNETIFSLARRAQVDPGAILTANCLTNASVLSAGQWLYVPPAAATAPGTLLPLGIDALAAYPTEVSAGENVTLYWHTQGPVIGVRVGWLANGQFVQSADNQPAGGSWSFAAPDDGRATFTLMVRASDGVREVAAQTTITIRCGESWFFSPAPSGCPRPPLVTAFVVQPFERGRMVYVPALKTHFVFADGQPARQIAESGLATASPADFTLTVALPQGLREPQGALAAAWRSDAALRGVLGWATGDAQRFTGLLQRAGDGANEAMYFAMGAGQVVRFQNGAAWTVLATR